MGELINGRTAEEIKRWLRWVTYRCDQTEDRCETCEYRDDCGEYCGSDTYKEALALIERLEAAQPRWISVKERLPEEVCRYLVITKRHEESSMVNTATYNHMGWWTHGNFGEITHWMPLPEPPKDGA